jgi:hypothetical protein
MDLLGRDIAVTIGLVTGLIGVLSTLIKEGKLERFKPALVVGTVAVSLLSFTAQLIQVAFDAQDKKQAAEAAQRKVQAERDRDAILSAIRGDVSHTSTVVAHTATVVEAISKKLEGVEPARVGDALISVATLEQEHERLIAFGKGSAEHWGRYADWLAANNERAQTVLTFDVNGSSRYALDLTLIYLLTAAQTRTELEPRMRTRSLAWLGERFVERALLDWRGVDYVLIRDQRSGAIVAYARARDFTRDLVLRARSEGEAPFRATFNGPQADLPGALRKLSPALRAAAVESADVASLVKIMLDKGWSECVLTQRGAPYLIALEKLVRVANDA